MSRVGKKIIDIPSDVTVTIEGNTVSVKGPKGELSQTMNERMTYKQEENTLEVVRPTDSQDDRTVHGTTRALINNMIQGVKDGYKKSLTVNGVGYKLNKQGKKLVMNLGLSHPVEVEEPAGITFEVPDNNTILVCGANKELVGEVAAKIRALRPIEPYHGYGIHYTSEPVILKPGKAAGKKK